MVLHAHAEGGQAGEALAQQGDQVPGYFLSQPCTLILQQRGRAILNDGTAIRT